MDARKCLVADNTGGGGFYVCYLHWPVTSDDRLVGLRLSSLYIIWAASGDKLWKRCGADATEENMTRTISGEQEPCESTKHAQTQTTGVREETCV
jgi:hypothetical protein